MARVVHAAAARAQQRRGHGTRRGRVAGARGSGGGSTFAAGGTHGGREFRRVQQTQKGGKLTTTSYLLPLLYRVPAGRPATPAQGSALALGFISESSGILASSHTAEGQPSQASSRGVEALRASDRPLQRARPPGGARFNGTNLARWRPTGRRSQVPAPRGAGVAAHDGGQPGAARAARSRRRRGGTAAAALAVGLAKALGVRDHEARLSPTTRVSRRRRARGPRRAERARVRRRVPDARRTAACPRRGARPGLGRLLRLAVRVGDGPRARVAGAAAARGPAPGRRARAKLAGVPWRGPDAYKATVRAAGPARS